MWSYGLSEFIRNLLAKTPGRKDISMNNSIETPGNLGVLARTIDNPELSWII
jgi:hypothetical protein